MSQVARREIHTFENASDDPATLSDWGRAGLSATSATESFLKEIERRRELNAYITVTPDLAQTQAEESDARTKRGKRLPLDGVPLAIKDNFCTRGVRSTAGSRILDNFVPTYESHVTDRLLKAGAVFLGKTNMDEFGMGSSTENSAYGPTLNPRRARDGAVVVPGGSSGGSAAAVAANLCVAALGTDTGGSLRQPAAFCGVVGFKPTYGLCSRWGIMAYASSFDQAGVITKTTLDAAMLTDIIMGVDDRDSTSMPWKSTSLADSVRNETPRLRVGIPQEMREAGGSAELESLWNDAARLCAEAGHEVVRVSIPSLKAALPAYYVLVLCEASSNLARYDGVRYGHRAKEFEGLNDLYEKSRSEGFSQETQRRILLGTFALSAGYYDQYYLRAARVRAKLASEFQRAAANVDVFMWPTAPSSAFEFGSHTADPVAMYLEDVFTVPVNLVGAPAVSIPVKNCNRGLPLGVQFIGARFGDAKVLQAANSVEKVAQFS